MALGSDAGRRAVVCAAASLWGRPLLTSDCVAYGDVAYGGVGCVVLLSGWLLAAEPLRLAQGGHAVVQVACRFTRGFVRQCGVGFFLPAEGQGP